MLRACARESSCDAGKLADDAVRAATTSFATTPAQTPGSASATATATSETQTWTSRVQGSLRDKRIIACMVFAIRSNSCPSRQINLVRWPHSKARRYGVVYFCFRRLGPYAQPKQTIRFFAWPRAEPSMQYRDFEPLQVRTWRCQKTGLQGRLATSMAQIGPKMSQDGPRCPQKGCKAYDPLI